jgi:hypothetical protein
MEIVEEVGRVAAAARLADHDDQGATGGWQVAEEMAEEGLVAVADRKGGRGSQEAMEGSQAAGQTAAEKEAVARDLAEVAVVAGWKAVRLLAGAELVAS